MVIHDESYMDVAKEKLQSIQVSNENILISTNNQIQEEYVQILFHLMNDIMHNRFPPYL